MNQHSAAEEGGICGDTHFRSTCIKDFGNEILPRATPTTETNPDTITLQKPAMDTKWTASSSPEEPVTTQEQLFPYRNGATDQSKKLPSTLSE